jgi:alkylhydroperoxidase/carboxymuconolactone decarboxylase family protein YurZ
MPGGGPTRQEGFSILRRLVDELNLDNPIPRPNPRPYEEPDPNSTESREDRVKRITEQIFADLGYEDPNIAFGVELDPDYFEVYSKIYWGFWESRECHLDPITREMVLIVLMAFRGLREELYQHCKKALRLGATMEQLLECFQVCVAPAGLGQLHLGLEALRTIHEEQKA